MPTTPDALPDRDEPAGRIVEAFDMGHPLATRVPTHQSEIAAASGRPPHEDPADFFEQGEESVTRP